MKGIFIDYTGTMVREDGPYAKKLVEYFLSHSDFDDPVVATRFVWRMVKDYEEKSYLDSFITEDMITDRIIQYCAGHYGLSGDFEELRHIWQQSWVHAPLYDDVKPFFEKSPYPIYVITNDGRGYIEESMRLNGLSPAGIISAEDVRAYKPHKEIFDEAMRVSGLSPHELIHIGDSIESDVKGAIRAGIKPILIDRTGRTAGEGFQVIASLDEVFS